MSVVPPEGRVARTKSFVGTGIVVGVVGTQTGAVLTPTFMAGDPACRTMLAGSAVDVYSGSVPAVKLPPWLVKLEPAIRKLLLPIFAPTRAAPLKSGLVVAAVL